MYTKEDIRRAVDNDITVYAESKYKLIDRLKDFTIEYVDTPVVRYEYEDMEIYWDCPEAYEIWEDVFGTMKTTSTNKVGLVLGPSDNKAYPFLILWTDNTELVEGITDLIKMMGEPCYKNLIHTNYYKLLEQLNETLLEVTFGVNAREFRDALCEPLRQNYFDEERMKEVFTRVPIKDDNFLGPSGYSMNLDQIYDGLGIDLRKDDKNDKDNNYDFSDIDKYNPYPPSFEMIAFT